ncbi:MAG: GGDEF domain-containing protein [Spirochaetia bacterium]|nr:GGDEF domain-containing protein [Spirochaetia bacterium]
MNKDIKFILVFIFFLCVLQLAFGDQIFLTDQETEYIASREPIKGVSADGSGPIQYTDSKGEIKGISIKILEEISRRTGLTFEYTLYEELNQVGKAYYDGTDILFGIPDQYTRENYTVSEPILRSNTIFFANNSVDSNNLENKTFAATFGSPLPQGIKEENAIYFQSREQAIEAVDSKIADYGYGNPYSIAFYTLKNGYRHIYTIPHGKEERLYRILFIKEDPLLISIINKAISSLTVDEKQNIILAATSEVERELNLSVIIKTYGNEIFIISVIIISLLTFALFLVLSSYKKLNFQKSKYKTISEVSNEYLFEYNKSKNKLLLSEKFKTLFSTLQSLEQAHSSLTSILSTLPSDKETEIISLELPNKRTGFFRIVTSKIPEHTSKLIYIGKIIDISKMMERHNYLENLAQIDGLTGILNSITIRDKIEHRLLLRKKNDIDICILFDIDNFKIINDTKGHLEGDRVLQLIGDILTKNIPFVDSLIGRVGGDEFCVYLPKIASREIGITLCELLIKTFQSENIFVSMGSLFIHEEDSFEELFEKVDALMYTAKNNGKNRFVVE